MDKLINKDQCAVDLYAAGAPIRQIARQLQMGEERINRAINKLGIRRTRSEATLLRYKKNDDNAIRLQQAVELYRAEVPMHKIAKQLRIRKTRVVDKLKELGIYRSHSDAVKLGASQSIYHSSASSRYDPKMAVAIESYKSGTSLRAISKSLHLDEEKIKRSLVQTIDFRSHSEAVRLGKTDSIINRNAFDVLTADALYWIGFLYADGHIAKDRLRITLTLAEKDKDHLMKFCSFIGTDIEPLRLGSGAYRVAFSCKELQEALKQLGFTHDKTFKITPHEKLKNSRDFWRGVVDGDGWVYRTKSPVIGLSGYVDTLVGFKEYLNQQGASIGTSVRKRKTRENLWEFQITCNKAIFVGKLLYHGASVYLDRKYQAYLNF